MNNKAIISGKELDKIHNVLDSAIKAYWRVWMGHPLHNGESFKQDLKDAKRKLEELGV